ncbi:MAG TPA: fibrillarin-like rRNA/tRNA 2'-O-methyltransferase [Candidatus Thalassarchaeaceae archaeon]|nr:fibrillarin-like rRNA/tRNA 2'-O-methyltransferase [Candidatus Thalassarchaeaceae archaeon]
MSNRTRHKSRGKMNKLSNSVLTLGRGLWSKNAVPGVRVRGENLRKMEGSEWRNWSPRHSKLAAGILRTKLEPSELLPCQGSQALYLGAGHGTTVSHLHDHLCGEQNEFGGSIVAVDISSRCMRDLVGLAKKRPGLLPVLADARKPEGLRPWLNGRVDWLFQDVSQAGQVGLFIDAAKHYLADGGVALLSLKSASERIVEGGANEHYQSAAKAMEESGLEVLEIIHLKGWEEQHALISSIAPKEWPYN